MSQDPEPFAYTEAGEPVYYSADDGTLTDANGVEYEVPEPQPPQPYDYGQTGPSEEEMIAALQQHVATQHADLEQQLNRRLTPREKQAMSEEMGGQLERGEDVNVYAAHAQRGTDYNLDNTQERRQWMAESLKDGAPPAPVSRPPADAPAEDHRTFIKARLNGSPVDGEQ